MSSTKVLVQGIEMSVAAAERVAECGVDVHSDVSRVRRGRVTEADLLAECLDGADPDREQGWNDYVTAVVCASVEASSPELTRDQRRVLDWLVQARDGRATFLTRVPDVRLAVLTECADLGLVSAHYASIGELDEKVTFSVLMEEEQDDGGDS